MKEVMEQLILDPNNRPRFTLESGVLRYHGRLVIGNSEALKEKILDTLHGSPLGGHFRMQNTYQRAKQLFYWPKLKKEVVDYVMKCDTCKRCKHQTVAAPRLLQPLPTPTQACSFEGALCCSLHNFQKL